MTNFSITGLGFGRQTPRIRSLPAAIGDFQALARGLGVEGGIRKTGPDLPSIRQVVAGRAVKPIAVGPPLPAVIVEENDQSPANISPVKRRSDRLPSPAQSVSAPRADEAKSATATKLARSEGNDADATRSAKDASESNAHKSGKSMSDEPPLPAAIIEEGAQPASSAMPVGWVASTVPSIDPAAASGAGDGAALPPTSASDGNVSPKSVLDQTPLPAVIVDEGVKSPPIGLPLNRRSDRPAPPVVAAYLPPLTVTTPSAAEAPDDLGEEHVAASDLASPHVIGPPVILLAPLIVATASPAPAPVPEGSPLVPPASLPATKGETSPTPERPSPAPHHPVAASVQPAPSFPLTQALAALVRSAVDDHDEAAPRIEGVRAADASASASPVSSGIRITPPAALPSTAPLDTRRAEWIEALVDRIEEHRTIGNDRVAHIRLSPDSLGGVDVRIRQEGDRIHVSFTTDTAQARTLLTDAAPRLAELADARGLKLGDTGVAHQQGGRRDHPNPRADNGLVPLPATEIDDSADASSDRIA